MGRLLRRPKTPKFAALADQAKGILFRDSGKPTVAEYLERWLSDTAKYQVAQSIYARYERTVRNHFLHPSK